MNGSLRKSAPTWDDGLVAAIGRRRKEIQYHILFPLASEDIDDEHAQTMRLLPAVVPLHADTMSEIVDIFPGKAFCEKPAHDV